MPEVGLDYYHPKKFSQQHKLFVALKATGMKNTEIAESLHISTETVKNHVSTTIHKLGVRDRTQAVVFALTHGLVDNQLV